MFSCLNVSNNMLKHHNKALAKVQRQDRGRLAVVLMASGSYTAPQEQQHTVKGGHITYRVTPCQQQTKVDIVFLHGLLSDMNGVGSMLLSIMALSGQEQLDDILQIVCRTKARALEQQAQQLGHGFLCFNARGHASSSGIFQETHLGDWYSDALSALELAPAARHILVGSSFGGWQALHLAAEMPEEVAGLVLIAPALDFTARLWDSYSPQQQQTYQQQDAAPVGSQYLEGGQVMVNMRFFEEAKRFLVLDRLRDLRVTCPVRILHGVQDDVVPVSIAHKLFDELDVGDMVLSLVKDGDHRLARSNDLKLLLSTVEDLLQHVLQTA